MARQLPVGTCLRHAVTSVRNNLGQAFHVSWPWLLILFLLGAIGIVVLSYAIGNDNFWAAFLGFLVWMLVTMLAGAAIAVRWHRYVLLDEVVRTSEILTPDGKTWRYLGNILLIALLMILIQSFVAIPVRFLAGGTAAGGIVEFVVSLALLIISGVLTYRLSVKLPAIALGRHDFRFAHAWEATRGNSRPLAFVFLIQLVVSIAIVVVVYLLMLALMFVHPVLGIIGFAIYFVCFWLLGIFGITILTSFYGFFVENRDF